MLKKKKKKKKKKKCTGIIGLQSQQNGIALWREMWSVTSQSKKCYFNFQNVLFNRM